jgi:cytochrome c oxidase subunit 3
MSVILMFLGLIAGIAVWWFLQQRLTEKPWLQEGLAGGVHGVGAFSIAPAKLGLGVFLAVAGSLFTLLVSAYLMRMGLPDWRSLRVPPLLWFNTGVLILSSAALQGAAIAIHRKQMDAVRMLLLAAWLSAAVFVGGQIWAWQQLSAQGYFVAGNPADSFFYLMTGVHGLHVLGGLVALAIVTRKLWLGYAADRMTQSVEMCATYWHFLLIVWLVLFGLLTGWADDLGRICSQLLR